jgi:hypothetical protein
MEDPRPVLTPDAVYAAPPKPTTELERLILLAIDQWEQYGDFKTSTPLVGRIIAEAKYRKLRR